MQVSSLEAAAAGAGLAVVIGLSARRLRLDRSRAFYATVVIVIASYYALFAVIGGDAGTLLAEAGPIALFTGLGLAGFLRSSWWFVAALVLHGLFDAVHGRFIVNPGVPAWWPAFCLAYDLMAAAVLAALPRDSRDAAPATA